KDLKLKLPSFNNAYLGVVSADFRYYLKIWKQIIWANRLAWSSSFGTRKLIYYLGGVDGWIAPQYDNKNIPDESENYAFQTLATNMRGFKQNVRNGANYVILNSEIRIPVFTSIFN